MIHMRIRSGLIALLAVACVALTLAQESNDDGIEPFGGRADYVADLRMRRAKAAENLGPDAALVLWSAPPRVYSDDTNYEYRQESNLLYLTGLTREDVVFVLVPGSAGAKEFLFVPASDATQELWTGHIPTVAEIRARSGVDQVFAQRGTEAFDAFMAGLLGRSLPSAGGAGAASAGSANDVFALGASSLPASTNSLRLALLDYRQSSGHTPDSVEELRLSAWVRQQQERTSARALTFSNASAALRTQRQIKTPYEQRLLRRSVEISAEAHIEGMKSTRPGRWEYEVEAAIEHWFHKNGALSPGYPSIVGSGPNATTLHYLDSSRRMKDGELLLVDAAGNFQGLTGDITRTYPVGRRFTAEQRALYDVVLAAQEAGITAARPGRTAADIDAAVRRTLGVGLFALGLVNDPAAKEGAGTQLSTWFPHSAVHGIGVDVHDPLGRLDPGAAFVIEPGVYIRQDSFDALARNPAQSASVGAIRPAFAKHANSGIRIEDSFLMTSSGPENLSAKTPRLATDIERIVGTGRD